MKKMLFIILCISTINIIAQEADYLTDTTCLGELTTLTAISSIPDSLITGFAWDLDDDGLFDDATEKIVFFVPASDNNLVSLQISTNVDNYYTTKPVPVHPLPNVLFIEENSCEGSPAFFEDYSSISSGTITNYNWDFNNDGIIDDNTIGNVSYIYETASDYIAELVLVSDNGCTDSTTKNISVFNQPIADFIVEATCLGDSSLFINSSSINNDSICIYNWNFGDGEMIINSGNPKHKYNTSDNFTVTLIVISQNNCRDTVEHEAVVNAIPEISLEYEGDFEYEGDTIVFFEGNDISITVQGNYDNLLWSTAETSNSIIVNQTGNYLVEAEIDGCTSSISVNIIVNDIPGINVVNDIITPNGDEINDYLIIKDIEAYQKCELVIYSRWGKQVYSSMNYQNDWDGTINGNKLDAGTYFYIINTEIKKFNGHINILY